MRRAVQAEELLFSVAVSTMLGTFDELDPKPSLFRAQNVRFEPLDGAPGSLALSPGTAPRLCGSGQRRPEEAEEARTSPNRNPGTKGISGNEAANIGLCECECMHGRAWDSKNERQDAIRWDVLKTAKSDWTDGEGAFNCAKVSIFSTRRPSFSTRSRGPFSNFSAQTFALVSRCFSDPGIGTARKAVCRNFSTPHVVQFLENRAG